MVREKICTPDLELLSISIRPFYLPREFPQLFFTLVYIHPRANVASANQLIVEVTNRLDALSPDAPKFILGDFNHCQVQKTLKTYEQYVTCATTKKNSTIDLCYGSVPGAFRSLSMPPFGASYHNSILLVPIYKPICKRQEQTVISVKCWTENSIASLQACFDCTDWDVFYSSCSDLNELAQTVSSYISFCVDTNIPCKNITVFPNNKPWVTKELKNVINKKKSIFYTGNSQEKKEITREVRNEIRKAKRMYKDKVEHKYSSGDLLATWKGIKSMSSINQRNSDTDRKPLNIEGISDADQYF